MPKFEVGDFIEGIEYDYDNCIWSDTKQYYIIDVYQEPYTSSRFHKYVVVGLNNISTCTALGIEVNDGYFEKFEPTPAQLILFKPTLADKGPRSL